MTEIVSRNQVAAEIAADYQALRRAADGRAFTMKLTALSTLTGFGMFLTLTHLLWARLLGTLLVGVMFAHALELQHETLHGIAFRSRRRNVAAGVLLGAPMLVSFAAYQAAHLRHHRDLGTPNNKEFFDYGDQYGTEPGSALRRAGRWVYRFSMVAHYRQFLICAARVVGGRPLPGQSPVTERRVKRDHFVILTLLLAVTVVSVASHSLAVVWAWLLPLAVVAAPAHALIELPEHFRCDTGTPDVLANSRTIRSNRFMAWLTNTNNFHVEHHLVPDLPFSHLAKLHGVLAPHARHVQPTYHAFFRGLLAGDRRGDL